MKIMHYIHRIPETLIVWTIFIGILILIVYGFVTINALKRQVELNQIQQEERTESALKRAREEWQQDMFDFFNNNTVSCLCEE